MTVQQMVPKLFELTGSEQARACAGAPVWPAPLRLDALMPAEGHEANLAHLLAGHGGTLAWVKAVWFKAGVAEALMPVKMAMETTTESTALADSAAWLTQQLKKTFDPVGLFPPLQQTKGIESAT
jgi:hypothetical protein